jgi:dephospho-CoA kinase
MSEPRQILAFIRTSAADQSLWKKKISGFLRKSFRLIEYDLELEKLLAPEQEGYRQVVNYFGEDFRLKGGKLNIRKLERFVNEDIHKKKIFQVLMEPVFYNFLQSELDAFAEDSFAVFIPEPVQQKLLQRFTAVERI